MKVSSDICVKLRMPASASRPAQNSHLVNYALKGLHRCWLPEHGRWSHIYHLDGRAFPNESLPHSDVFYTLNVLLGMSRVAGIPDSVDVSEIFHRNVTQLTTLPMPKYAFGMALWAAAQLELEIPEPVARNLRTLLADQACWETFRAQDLGMLLTGVVAQGRAGAKEWAGFAGPLYRFLKERFHGGSGLFFDLSAITAATNCVCKLIALQGPQGEWPWFFDAASGRVLDFYEVYSVHQYGMAPALLECAESHGVPGAVARRLAIPCNRSTAAEQSQHGHCAMGPHGTEHGNRLAA
jgi:hypothetical protein